jgi:hypothetical protein
LRLNGGGAVWFHAQTKLGTGRIGAVGRRDGWLKPKGPELVSELLKFIADVDRRLPDHGPRQCRAGLDYVHDPEERIEAAKQRLLEWKAGDLVVRYAVSQEDIGKAEEDFRAGMSLYGLVQGAVLAELSSPGIRELPTSGEAFWGRASLLSVATCGPRQHLPMQIWNGRILHRYMGAHDQAKARAARAVSLKPGNSAGVVLADLFGELEIVMMDRTVLWPAMSRPTSRLCLRVELLQAPCAVACSDFGQNVYN